MYEETLSARFEDYSLAHSVLVPACPDYEVSAPAHEQNKFENPRLAGSGSLLDLLSDLERYSTFRDRSHAVACYQAWIKRNSAAPATLYAALFNLGVELAGAGDKGGALNAYQNALALRPDFYPATINLGTMHEALGQIDSALATWHQGLQSDKSRTALLDYRDRLAEAYRVKQQSIPAVLHVGAGTLEAELPPMFLGTDWREIRVSPDPGVHPDFTGDLIDMHVISDGLVDAVYSSQAIENLYPHEVPLALQEMRRVLKPTGFTLISLPDLQEVARYVAAGKLEEPLYMSPAGPVTPLDILYGHRASIVSGNSSNAPRTGFTSATLAAALINAGFRAALVQRDPATFRLTAIAFRSLPEEEQMERALAQILPALDRPTVLYRTAG
jgi:tetratricopeptide (TPR) repeat protein